MINKVTAGDVINFKVNDIYSAKGVVYDNDIKNKEIAIILERGSIQILLPDITVPQKTILNIPHSDITITEILPVPVLVCDTKTTTSDIIDFLTSNKKAKIAFEEHISSEIIEFSEYINSYFATLDRIADIVKTYEKNII